MVPNSTARRVAGASADPGQASPDAGLRVRELTVDLWVDGRLRRIVDGISFAVAPRGTLGIIGESGSGKSVTALALLDLLPASAHVGGEIRWRGEDLVNASPARRRRIRGREIAMVFQDPLAALNPTRPVGRQIGEILRRGGMRRAQAGERVVDLMTMAGIPDPTSRRRAYPHQLSGGLRQRVVIAMALAGEPSLLLADEPTTALDVTVQARILQLLGDIRAETGLAMILVSHDLRVVSHVTDAVAVMYAGRLAEYGPTRDVLRQPRHPYTRALIQSVPAVHSRSALTRPLPGTPVGPANRPAGCAFHPRCPLAIDRCAVEQPAWRPVPPGRWVACHRAEEVGA
ncbi:ABC transporter ATP-binding protein [Jiangella alba]|uniref:Peptide/nickel transport system ATP-binding protein n=1 Tax=Jiangella alba TaxID=561176 RepID=A0A1H5L8F3_9ACTN|nr:ABC transporter ATP-binding protein [Jiangella alba]SEE73349.1 peptide/nickel transport system ATP-binding protein [Jiangella alba]